MKEFSADRLERLLDTVLKPARYTGGEMNAVCKPFSDADVTFAFCFPDSYEVGMSHLGIKILYDIINRRPWALCERVFMPWPDMADGMRRENLPLFSIESRTPCASLILWASPCNMKCAIPTSWKCWIWQTSPCSPRIARTAR